MPVRESGPLHLSLLLTAGLALGSWADEMEDVPVPCKVNEHLLYYCADHRTAGKETEQFCSVLALLFRILYSETETETETGTQAHAPAMAQIAHIPIGAEAPAILVSFPSTNEGSAAWYL